MSTRENVLFNIMPDITPKINDDGVAFSLRSRDYKDAQFIVLENHPADSRVKIQEDNVFQTLSSRMGTGGGNVPMVLHNDKEDNNMETQNNTIVRRLTPLECERLQNLPDNWTNIGEWTDTKGKKRQCTDGNRYRALGNSIALPFWAWMAERMVNVLKADGVENPTMASLFDGVSSFCLVYKRCGCEPVWTSEVEEFCIAVAKKHFGDDEKGEKGDIDEYL